MQTLFRRAPLRPALAAALTAALTAALASAAQAQADEPDTQRVVVTASRSDTRLQDMPLHTTVITQAEIRQSPAQTLDQLLRNAPGLLLPGAPAYTTDPTGQNIKLRGMDKKVLVLVDGVPVLDPFYGTVQWFKLPLSAVERVEIVRGGGSSLWGNLAVGGVINIVSKRPKADAGSASLTAGSLNTVSAAISQDWGLTDAVGVTVSADSFTTDGYNNTPADLRAAYWPGRGNSSASARNLRLGLFFQPAAGVDGYARVGYHEQNETIGGYAYGANRQRSPDGQAGLNWRLDPASRLAATLYAQRVNFDKFNGAGCYAAATYACGAAVSGSGASAAQQTADTLQYASSHDLNTYRERGGSLVYTRRFDGGVTGGLTGWLTEWQAGLDLRQIAGEDAQASYRTPTAALPAALRIQRSNYGAGTQAFTGVFSQFKLNPVEALALTLSARADRYTSRDGSALQTNYSNVAAPVETPATGGPVPDSSKQAFDPSLSARYAVSPALALRASAYKAFRAPGLNNLYRSFGSSSISIANPLLEPETLVGEEIGADWKGQGWTFGATLFRADVKNVVATYAITAATPVPAAVQNICGAGYAGVANAACPGTVSFYTNGQDQRATGVELDARWALNDRFQLGAYLTQTATHYTRTVTGDPTGVQLPLVPRRVAGVNAAWQATAAWTLNAELRASSDMTLSSLTLNPPLRQGGYAVVNLSAGWRLSADTELSASVVNAGDKRYTDASASNPQGISMALPRVLSLGLRGRW